MRTSMKTFEALPEHLQSVAKAMSDAARQAMRAEGFPPMNDDRAARFDEACAVFLNDTLIEADHPACVLS